jgi:hypothetical protein
MSGLREHILLSQQMKSPIFQIGVLYTGSNDFSTDHHTSHLDAIAIGWDSSKSVNFKTLSVHRRLVSLELFYELEHPYRLAS